MKQPTYFGLMAEFGGGEIRLAECCEKYFGLSEAQAKRKAALRELPVPAYKLTDGKSGEWLVSLSELAEHIDRQRAKYSREHMATNSGLRA
jgi:hypothetical protein